MRITKRDTYGKAYAVGDNVTIEKGIGIEHRSPSIIRGDIVDKLAEYEDVCDTPAEPVEKKVIDEIICPYCGSGDTTPYSTDEIEFSPCGTGHYYVDVSCFNCEKSFRKHYKFKYEIMEEY